MRYSRRSYLAAITRCRYQSRLCPSGRLHGVFSRVVIISCSISLSRSASARQRPQKGLSGQGWGVSSTSTVVPSGRGGSCSNSIVRPRITPRRLIAIHLNQSIPTPRSAQSARLWQQGCFPHPFHSPCGPPGKRSNSAGMIWLGRLIFSQWSERHRMANQSLR